MDLLDTNFCFILLPSGGLYKILHDEDELYYGSLLRIDIYLVTDKTKPRMVHQYQSRGDKTDLLQASHSPNHPQNE